MAPADLFNPTHYERVRRPLLEAETLPPWCYTSEAFFQREQERIFLKCWHFVAREDEIPDTGDYLTFDGAGGPVLLIRSDNGRVRAFYNACRHRGTRLLDGAGCSKRVVCPYHSWAYAADGELLRAQGMDGVIDFRRAEYSLLPVRFETWAGFMFICYANDSPSLSEYLGDMPSFFAAWRPQELRVVRRVHYDIHSNWKLLIENALEAYHTGTVHAATLGRQESKPVQTQGQWDALLVDGEESVAVLPDQSTSLPHIEGLSGEQAGGTYFTDIYPCTQFVFAQDCMWWLAIQPDGPENCRMVLGACFPESTIRLPQFEAAVGRYYERWNVATPEDNAIAEAQQVGQRAAARRPGRFAGEERAVHNLAGWVLDQVLD